MPFTNQNNNSSLRAGRGLGPCGAGMARGRGAGFRQNVGMGFGMGPGMGRGFGAGRGQGFGPGQGLGLRRRDGSCRFLGGQEYGPTQYENDLERRIADLEAENQQLKAEANK